MGFLLDKCTLKPYNEEVIGSCKAFDCDHADLNDFFQNDVLNYSEQLLGKTYCFTLDEDPSIIVCALTISNDSIKTTNLPNSRKKKLIKEIPRPKQMGSYPAVLIGRLGVNKEFRTIEGEEERISKQLMDFINPGLLMVRIKPAVDLWWLTLTMSLVLLDIIRIMIL